MINWSNLSFAAAARQICRLAYKYGWDRACEIAKKELGEDADEAIRLAFKWDAQHR